MAGVSAGKLRGQGERGRWKIEEMRARIGGISFVYFVTIVIFSLLPFLVLGVNLDKI